MSASDMKTYIMKGLGYKLMNRDSPRDEAAFIGKDSIDYIPELLPHETDAAVDIKKHVVSKTEEFFDLPLFIRYSKDMPASLIHYCKPERVEIHCNDGVLRPAMRTKRILELPTVLCLQLPRYFYSQELGRTHMACDSFEVPATLDMTESRYNHMFNIGCKRKKYILIGMLAGTYDPHTDFTTWHIARLRHGEVVEAMR